LLSNVVIVTGDGPKMDFEMSRIYPNTANPNSSAQAVVNYDGMERTIYENNCMSRLIMTL
jgi:hypothetical protein